MAKVKIELFDGRELTQERVVARRIKNIMEFFMKAEKKDKDGKPVMSEFELIDGMVELACSIFPKEKGLNDYLWDNYEMDELIDLCENIIAQATGGNAEEGEKAPSENA